MERMRRAQATPFGQPRSAAASRDSSCTESTAVPKLQSHEDPHRPNRKLPRCAPAEAADRASGPRRSGGAPGPGRRYRHSVGRAATRWLGRCGSAAGRGTARCAARRAEVDQVRSERVAVVSPSGAIRRGEVYLVTKSDARPGDSEDSAPCCGFPRRAERRGKHVHCGAAHDGLTSVAVPGVVPVRRAGGARCARPGADR